MRCEVVWYRGRLRVVVEKPAGRSLAVRFKQAGAEKGAGSLQLPSHIGKRHPSYECKTLKTLSLLI